MHQSMYVPIIIFFFNPLATMKTWKNISIFVAVPAILICAYNAVTKEMEHHTHPRPGFVAYPHLRIRSKVRFVLLNLMTIMASVEHSSTSGRCSISSSPCGKYLSHAQCGSRMYMEGRKIKIRYLFGRGF